MMNAPAPTVNNELAAERARKSMAFSSMSQRQLSTIANSSSTAGRWSWLEISVAASVIAARAEANRLRAENNARA